MRLAFGCRNVHDTKCTADDFESTGNLDAEELLFSQQEVFINVMICMIEASNTNQFSL